MDFCGPNMALREMSDLRVKTMFGLGKSLCKNVFGGKGEEKARVFQEEVILV